MSLKKTSENMMRMSIKISVYTLLVVGMIILATRGYRFGEDVFSEKGTEDYPGTDITVTIEQGASTMEVAQMLKNKGLVKDKIIFYVQSYLYEGSFIPGEYTLNTSLSPETIVEKLSTPVTTTE